jgi:hypothetical protein
MEVSSQGHDPAALLSGKNPNTHWVAGWVGPRTYVDVLEDKKVSFVGIRTLYRPASSLVPVSELIR